MRIEIVGAGALGLMFGAALSAAGNEVSFWTRTLEQAEALSRQGITVDQADGTGIYIAPERYKARSSGEPREVGRQEIWPDWILVTTKQRHLDEQLLGRIAEWKGPGTRLICFQNGMGHVERLSEALNGEKVLSALTTEGARKKGHGTVVRAGVGQTRIGLSGGQIEVESHLQQAKTLADSLSSAGFPSILSNDIDKEIYRKLAINAAINPLTAIWRIPNGELLASEQRRGMLQSLIKETIKIYDEYGIRYDSDIEDQVFHVCRSTFSNRSSMLKDVLAGEVTEIDHINGYLVQMAHRQGIQVPSLELVWRLVSAMTV